MCRRGQKLFAQLQISRRGLLNNMKLRAVTPFNGAYPLPPLLTCNTEWCPRTRRQSSALGSPAAATTPPRQTGPRTTHGPHH